MIPRKKQVQNFRSKYIAAEDFTSNIVPNAARCLRHRR